MAIVAVFLPVALMPGIAGQYFKAFGFTVVMSVLMSLLVARMITPLIAAYFLRSHGQQPHADFEWMDVYLRVLNWSLDTSKAHAHRLLHPGFGGKLMSLFRDHRIYMVGAGIGALLLSVVSVRNLADVLPAGRQRQPSDVNFTLPPGTTLKQSEVVADRVARIVAKNPNAERMFERVNVGDGHVSIVVLKKDRKQTSTEFERSLAPQLAAIPDARASFQSQNGGGPGDDSRDIMLYLGGDDPVQLIAVANKIAKEMADHPRAPRAARRRLARAAGNHHQAALRSRRRPRRDDRGAEPDDPHRDARRHRAEQREILALRPPDSDQRLAVRECPARPFDAREPAGSDVERRLGSAEGGRGYRLRRRTDHDPAHEPDPPHWRSAPISRRASSAATSGRRSINLPTLQHLPQGVQKLNLGDQKWQAELVYYFVMALLAGVLLVFAVLVLLYRRFLAPFVNMGSLLLAPLGAAIGLHIAGQPVSLPVLIGILMLFGIVAKNSILLVDFAVEMMNHGMEKDEAINEAGHKRAQPIVMTTVAMVAGMLPIALSLSGDFSWRAPMGVTVIGGLIFSTILTLLLVPAYFSLAISVESRIGRVFHRLVGSDAHQAGHPVPAE